MCKVAKFEVGDKVRCVKAEGWTVNAGCKIGNVYIVKYVDDADIKLLLEDGMDLYLDPSHFKLEERSVPCENDNPNVKMITTFVPTWAKYMAMNSMGGWCVYSQAPTRGRKLWVKSYESKKLYIGKCDPKELQVDWKDTLHEV